MSIKPPNIVRSGSGKNPKSNWINFGDSCKKFNRDVNIRIIYICIHRNNTFVNFFLMNWLWSVFLLKELY